MVNSADFSKRLEKIMDEHDLNAAGFADMIQVGRSSISHIISGRNKPSLEFVLKIIEAFPDVSLYWLLNGKGDFPASRVEKKTVDTSTHKQTATPSLFTVSEEQEQPQSKPIEIPASHTESDIERIVIFYTDGTFKNYTP